MTCVGRLVIVDLAGNERLEVAADYVAESSSINKSLFFLGKAPKIQFSSLSQLFRAVSRVSSSFARVFERSGWSRLRRKSL